MKSFATSICPIKNPLAVNMRHWVAAPSNPRAIPAPSQCHPRAIPASSQRGETITQPISKRFLSGVITGLRHGDLAQRCLRGSPAPSPRHPRAIPVPSPHHPRLANRSFTEYWPIRGLFHGHRGAHWVLQSVFGTATLPTGASEPSPRGEAVIYRPFGTGTLPRGVSEASPRGGPSPNRSQNGFFPVS